MEWEEIVERFRNACMRAKGDYKQYTTNEGETIECVLEKASPIAARPAILFGAEEKGGKSVSVSLRRLGDECEIRIEWEEPAGAVKHSIKMPLISVVDVNEVFTGGGGLHIEGLVDSYIEIMATREGVKVR